MTYERLRRGADRVHVYFIARALPSTHLLRALKNARKYVNDLCTFFILLLKKLNFLYVHWSLNLFLKRF